MYIFHSYTAAELLVLATEALAGIPVQLRKGPLTVRQILAELSAMVTVVHCDVFGYLSLDGDIVVLLKPVVDDPSPLQVCRIESLLCWLHFMMDSSATVINFITVHGQF